LVIDLGCGSGRWAAELNQAGYSVLGIDQSAAMIRMARLAAPEARFQIGSFLKFDFPACDGITSFGECLNYCFDESNSSRSKLISLFKRAYRALRPGGLFVLDSATPSRFPVQMPRQSWREGPGWAVLVTTDGDRERNILLRQIVSFRKRGRLYRRSEELHSLNLYRTEDLLEDLTRCGFQAKALRRFGSFRLPRGIAAFVAIKPEKDAR
jgi:SAM-dependent methyltransferase